MSAGSLVQPRPGGHLDMLWPCHSLQPTPQPDQSTRGAGQVPRGHHVNSWNISTWSITGHPQVLAPHKQRAELWEPADVVLTHPGPWRLGGRLLSPTCPSDLALGRVIRCPRSSWNQLLSLHPSNSGTVPARAVSHSDLVPAVMGQHHQWLLERTGLPGAEGNSGQSDLVLQEDPVSPRPGA